MGRIGGQTSSKADETKDQAEARRDTDFAVWHGMLGPTGKGWVKTPGTRGVFDGFCRFIKFIWFMNVMLFYLNFCHVMSHVQVWVAPCCDLISVVLTPHGTLARGGPAKLCPAALMSMENHYFGHRPNLAKLRYPAPRFWKKPGRKKSFYVVDICN